MNASTQIYHCPGCGHTDENNFQIAGALEAYACPSCGLTADEGRKRFQQDLATLFEQGMSLSPSQVSLQTTDANAAVPASELGYSVSQHYHHSSHVTTPTTTRLPEFGLQSPVMQMDTQTQTSNYPQMTEPYMRSGYEYLAQRDYERQTDEYQQPQQQQQHGIEDVDRHTHLLDPGFSAKEWWKGFVDQQPIEYQYGMFEQVSNQDQVKPMNATEDEEMS